MQVKESNEYQFPELGSKTVSRQERQTRKNDVRQHESFIGKWGYRRGGLCKTQSLSSAYKWGKF